MEESENESGNVSPAEATPQSDLKQGTPQEPLLRVRMPKGNQTIGIVERRLGAARMRVLCLDKKRRICRIPGALKRYLWVREGNIVLVKPWELSGDERGDVIFKYSRSQTDWLRKKGYLSQLEDLEEF